MDLVWHLRITSSVIMIYKIHHWWKLSTSVFSTTHWKKCFPVSQYKKLSAKQYPSSSSITQTLSTTIPETLLSNVIPQASSTTILETFLSIIIPQTLSTTIPEKLSFQHYPSNTTDYYNTGNTIFQALSTTIPETWSFTHYPSNTKYTLSFSKQ